MKYNTKKPISKIRKFLLKKTESKHLNQSEDNAEKIFY